MTKKISIHYGVDSLCGQVVDAGLTVADLKANDTFRSALGYGDNIKVLKSGIELPDTTVLGDGDAVKIETGCNQKAA